MSATETNELRKLAQAVERIAQHTARLTAALGRLARPQPGSRSPRQTRTVKKKKR